MRKNEQVHEALDRLKAVLAKYKAGEYSPAFAAAEKVINAASEIAQAGNVDVSTVLTGDLVHDRAVIEAAGVEDEIKATGISLEGAVEFAGALLKFGTIIVSMV